MYTSDNSKRKTVIVYSLVTLFCAVFSYIYGKFSHGVTSDAMSYMYVLPLLFGVIPFEIIRLGGFPYPEGFAKNFYDSGIAALTVGSCVYGVFEIYGSTTGFIWIYLAAGAALTLAGIILYIIQSGHARKQPAATSI